jgi:hypothetical protein
MQNSNIIWDFVDSHSESFIGLSDRVFDIPETLYRVTLAGKHVQTGLFS